VIALAATVITLAALLVAVLALVVTRSWRVALQALLDLLTAAGLIRLSGTPGWTVLANAAVVIVLRRVVSVVLVGAAASGRQGGAGAEKPAPIGVGSPHDQAR
jgi:hypothetical protein